MNSMTVLILPVIIYTSKCVLKGSDLNEESISSY